jgi:flagellar basal body-associated protein FliL
MLRLTRKKKMVTALVALVIVAAGGTAAYAYWSSSGATGTGTATTATQSNTLTITQTSSPSGLAPGVAPTSVSGQITDAASGTSTFVNQVVVTVSSVTPTSGNTCSAGNYGLVSGAATTAFTSSGSSIGTTTPSLTLSIGQDITPGGTITLPAFSIGFVDYTTVNQNGCQGATPQLTYTLS